MKIGLVTCEKEPDLPASERPLIDLFRAHGHVAQPVIWNKTVRWNEFDLLIIRSLWDYHLYPKEFSTWLQQIEKLNIPTFNPIPTLRWNHHKFYLRELETKGIAIAPTIFIPKTNSLDLSEVNKRNWRKAVIKPAVSASSFHTRAFEMSELPSVENDYRSLAQERDLLVQEFMPEVPVTGELSVILFNRIYSHTILKKARPGEFRVQSEYGGSATLIDTDQLVIQAAKQILSLISGKLLYARIDGVMRNGKFVLMEAELIEPYLFFGLAPGSPEKFVRSCLELAGK
ncbi:MAG: hypothetical protein K2U26_03935 [Cyclobacteriaceae bacterium]|nr:hypothetical protein [Cyclobacteriaceae bacterium]